MKSIKEFVFNILPADKWLKLSQVNNSPVVIAALYAIVYFGAKLHGINIPNGLLSTVSINTVSSVIGNGATSLIKNIVKKGKASPEEIQEILNDINQRTDKNIELSNKLLELNKELLKNEDFEKSISQLSESLHIDINNLKNEVNEKLDEIKEELSIISSPNIQKMEAVLHGDEKSSSGKVEPKFFRAGGPNWVDFEKGYVYERNEVKEAIRKLQKEDIIIIKGKPASGKSVILRNIGYKLIQEGHDVYYIQLKGAADNSEIVKEFKKIQSGIVIVDDAHLDKNTVESFIKAVINNKEVKLIIGSREIDFYKILGPTNETNFSKFFKNAIKVKASDAAEQIIEIYKEKEDKKIPQNIVNQIKNSKHLWIMVWKLRTYEESGNIDKKSFYKTVKTHIKTLLNSVSESTSSKNVESIILILSTFYKYEISVRKSYIEDLEWQEFIDEETLKNLITPLNEISLSEDSEGREYYSMHHSEIARIYFDTFRYYENKDFGHTIRKKIARLAEQYGIDKDTDKFWIETTLLINYIESYPEEFNRFIGQVPGEIQDTLLQNKYFLNLIPEIFKSYQSFDDYGTWHFYENKLIPKIRSNKNLKSKIDNIGPEVFEEKIRKWNNIWDITDLLETLNNIEYDGLPKILKNLKPEALEIKINECENVYAIGKLLKVLKEVEYEGLQKIRKDTFVEKIKEWKDIGKINHLIEHLYWARYKGLQEVFKDIKPKMLKEKIEKWNNADDNKYLELILKELHYPHLEKLKELLEPAGLWLID